ncbi:MAG: rfaC 1 [Verrucomicrobia bacterium]|nr:rfaC 1 [Verrucomicrobiota bacterium]
MRILVLRGGALGDFIVTLPALARLRSRWPRAHIELVGNPSAATLALNRALVDRVHSQHEARWSALYGRADLPEALDTWLGEFDLVINFWPDRSGELARRFPRRPAQTFLSADAMPATAPAAAHFCAALRPLGLEPGEMIYPLRVAKPEAGEVAIHPGSGSPRKNWPVDRWRELSDWLATDQGLSVTTISGEAEDAEKLSVRGHPLHHAPLDQVADHLARCSLFIGHDSGISHLAAAAGTKCLLLFGPTDPAVWAPPAPTVRVLRRGADLSLISLAEVQQAVVSARRDRT